MRILIFLCENQQFLLSRLFSLYVSVRLPTSILFLNGDFQCNPEVPGKMGNVSFGSTPAF